MTQIELSRAIFNLILTSGLDNKSILDVQIATLVGFLETCPAASRSHVLHYTLTTFVNMVNSIK